MQPLGLHLARVIPMAPKNSSTSPTPSRARGRARALTCAQGVLAAVWPALAARLSGRREAVLEGGEVGEAEASARLRLAVAGREDAARSERTRTGR